MIPDYHTYALEDCSVGYAETVVKKWSGFQESLSFQIKNNAYDPADPTSILPFLTNNKQNCVSYKTDGGNTMRFVRKFMTRSTASSYASNLYHTNKKTSTEPESMLPIWEEFVHYLPETYTSKYIIDGTKMDMKQF